MDKWYAASMIMVCVVLLIGFVIALINDDCKRRW